MRPTKKVGGWGNDLGPPSPAIHFRTFRTRVPPRCFLSFCASPPGNMRKVHSACLTACYFRARFGRRVVHIGEHYIAIPGSDGFETKMARNLEMNSRSQHLVAFEDLSPAARRWRLGRQKARRLFVGADAARARAADEVAPKPHKHTSSAILLLGATIRTCCKCSCARLESCSTKHPQTRWSELRRAGQRGATRMCFSMGRMPRSSAELVQKRV